MSPKARRLKAKRIPRSARWKAHFRSWASSFWADIRGKTKARRVSRSKPWPICPLCERQAPPWMFDRCEEHLGTCGCCAFTLHVAPPQGGRQRKKARPDQFRKGDPARQGYRTEKEQHADRQAEHQAEIVEQARQERTEPADVGVQDSSEGGGEE